MSGSQVGKIHSAKSCSRRREERTTEKERRGKICESWRRRTEKEKEENFWSVMSRRRETRRKAGIPSEKWKWMTSSKINTGRIKSSFHYKLFKGNMFLALIGVLMMFAFLATRIAMMTTMMTMMKMTIIHGRARRPDGLWLPRRNGTREGNATTRTNS